MPSEQLDMPPNFPALITAALAYNAPGLITAAEGFREEVRFALGLCDPPASPQTTEITVALVATTALIGIARSIAFEAGMPHSLINEFVIDGCNRMAADKTVSLRDMAARFIAMQAKAPSARGDGR